MQHAHRFFLALCLFLTCAACLTVAAQPASGAASAKDEYQKAAGEWRALLADNARAKLRDPWLALEKRFLAVAAKDPGGDTGAKGQYQAARCREELAGRSALESDWRNAANLYLDLGKKFPKHSLADDGLFHAASIAAGRLGKPAEARTLCAAILKNYPKGDMAGNAKKLLASLPDSGKGDKGGARNRPAAKPASSGSKPSSSGSKPSSSGSKPAGSRSAAPAAKPERPGTLIEQLGLTVNTIVIDAGHGGKDPGAIGNGITEAQVTLTLAKLLGERLRKQGFTVLYIRENNASVALDRRPVIANDKKADLFVSLHVNASKDAKTNGLETYFLDLARTSSAATVAARENAVSVKNISDLQFILTDIMLTSKLQESQDLAAVIHKNMYGRLRQAGFTVNDNGVRSAPFYVLMGARMPAVLVEIGYLTNAADARRIKSQKYLERVADGITLGIVDYRKKLGRFAGR